MADIAVGTAIGNGWSRRLPTSSNAFVLIGVDNEVWMVDRLAQAHQKVEHVSIIIAKISRGIVVIKRRLGL